MTQPSPFDLQAVVETAVETARACFGKGQVASYIPALADEAPDQLGLSVVTLEGHIASAGDAQVPFSIQSISKVFTLAMALEDVGSSLWDSVGREPSGTKFNSIVQLESEGGKPRNPLINAGAIATTARLIAEGEADKTIERIENFMQTLAADPSVEIDHAVAASESATGARNRSLAHFMSAFENLTPPVETVLSVYFHQCALRLSCQQLARAGLFLANNGIDPLTGAQIVSPEHCRQINAAMILCGHYDNSGEFAVRVGLPGKSGVGGGILAIAPGHGTAVAWSPALNDAGTSFAGSAALESFTSGANWSVFN